jgi:antitoxin YefM
VRGWLRADRFILYTLPVQEDAMAKEITYTAARANLAALCDEAASNREVVMIHRRGAEDVALVSAAELRSLAETAHLLRSPRNAARLLAAISRAQRRRGPARSMAWLRRELKLDEKE